MKKKKAPETALPPNLIQEGPAIGLPVDPANEVIQDAIIIQGKAIPVGKSEPAPVEASKEVTKVVVPKWTGPKWDYEHLPASGPHPNAEYYAKFKKLGEDGWEFIGKDSYGRNVFKRPGQS